MSNTTQNLKILWESERILRSAQWRITSQKINFAVVAGIAGLFGLGMINLALFYWLEIALGKPQAALLVAIIDILIAVVADDRTGGTEDTIKKFLINSPGGHLKIVSGKSA